MADSLYLSLWFADFGTENMFAHAFAVMQQFPFSKRRPGITSVSLHPVSWNEATIIEEQFGPGVAPQDAIAVAAGLIHEDYAYVFEAKWELWNLQESTREWILEPCPVKFIVRGEEFEEGESKREGDIQLDFGLDTPFLYEEVELTGELESRVRANVQGLIELINGIEKNTRTSARLLWSESDENLAQKLVNRLQKVQ